MFDANNYICLEAEKVIASPKLGIAGTVDLLLKKDNQLYIADWKFVREIKYNNIWRKAKFPIQHLDDCNYYKYVLQLNLYSYILRKEGYFPDYQKHNMVLYHITDEDINIIEVPNYITVIKSMLAYYIEERSYNGTI